MPWKPKYTPKQLKKGVEDYFEEKNDTEKKLKFCSITDLCRFLKIDRATFYRYKKKAEYAAVAKRAETVILSVWEEQLFYPGRNSVGAMFYLKNFGGMADKVEHQHIISGQIDHNQVNKLEQLDQDTLEQLGKAVDMIENRKNAIDAGEK